MILNADNLELTFDSPYNVDFGLINIDLDFDNEGSASDNIVESNLVFNYDFSLYNDKNNIYSLVDYSGCTINTGITLNNIGLTGIDTGYVQSLSGVTLTLNDNKLKLKPVTGITQNYDIIIEEESITELNLFNFQGGFYQGFYKLYNRNYEVLPNRTENGFTFNFWLKRDTNIITGNTLNSDNFFFFIGSRAENKFHNIFSGETQLTTTNGILLDNTSGTTTDVNGIGFYYNNNYIGYKNIINRIDSSGNTLLRLDTTGTSISITSANTWINLVITFTRNQKLVLCDDGCSFIPPAKLLKIYDGGCEEDIPDTQMGVLDFFINGRPIFSEIIEEPIFRELTTESEKQEGVPFNISIGGGTQGLLETQTFNGPDLDDQNLFMQENFGGTFRGFIGSVSMYSIPLSIPQIIKNFNNTKSIYKREENFGGPKIII